MTIREDSLKGKRYSDAYKDVLDEVFTELRQILHEKVEECPVRDKEGLMEIKYLLHNLNQLEGIVTRTIETGHFADIELEQEQKRQERREGVQRFM